MEFERAIYRVYERCMEGISDEDTDNGSTTVGSKSCRFLEMFALLSATALLVILIILHASFVNSAGCLPQFVTMDAVGNTSSLRTIREDNLLYIRIQPDLRPQPASIGSRPKSDAVGAFFNAPPLQYQRFMPPQQQHLNGIWSARTALEGFFRPGDVQPCSIGSGSSSSTTSSSSISRSSSSSSLVEEQESRRRNHHLRRASVQTAAAEAFDAADIDTLNLLLLPSLSSWDANLAANDTDDIPQLGGSGNTSSSSNSTSTNSTAHPAAGENSYPPAPDYDYLFAMNAGLLLLTEHQLRKHDFELINVTLAGDECFGSASLQGLIPFGGVDSIIVNFLMRTVMDAGHVVTRDGEYFKWSWHDLRIFYTIGDWLAFKFNMLVYSCLAFFFLSTITALLVRALISSGVVLMFPIFGLLRLCGLHGINLRIVSISYPWIGIPLEMIRARNQPMYPFLIAHITRLVVYYFMYQATQVVFTFWFYNRDSPGQQELWVFAVMMLWEYYSMIYVRSAASIQLFPRASTALFLVYHFYYYSYPGGFHVLALVVMFCYLVALMIYCIRVFELKAFNRGLINFTQPRMLHNALPWPSLRPELAPEYTLFMPVNARTSSAYQTNIPQRPGTAPAGAGGGGATAAAAGGAAPNTATAGADGSESRSPASNAATASSSSSPASAAAARRGPGAAGAAFAPVARGSIELSSMTSRRAAAGAASSRGGRDRSSGSSTGIAGDAEPPVEEAEVSLLSSRDGGYDGDRATPARAAAAAPSSAGGGSGASFFGAVANTARSVAVGGGYRRVDSDSSHGTAARGDGASIGRRINSSMMGSSQHAATATNSDYGSSSTTSNSSSSSSSSTGANSVSNPLLRFDSEGEQQHSRADEAPR